MSRPWLIVLLCIAGCAGSPATLPVRPEPAAGRAEVERLNAVWRKERRETALEALAGLPALPPGDARRLTLARIHYSRRISCPNSGPPSSRVSRRRCCGSTTSDRLSMKGRTRT